MNTEELPLFAGLHDAERSTPAHRGATHDRCRKASLRLVNAAQT